MLETVRGAVRRLQIISNSAFEIDYYYYHHHHIIIITIITIIIIIIIIIRQSAH